jgi:hypothetical protein
LQIFDVEIPASLSSYDWVHEGHSSPFLLSLPLYRRGTVLCLVDHLVRILVVDLLNLGE